MKPPMSPAVRKALVLGLLVMGRLRNMPMKKQPRILTRNVPIGKSVAGKSLVIDSDKSTRPVAPMKPPAPTQRSISNIMILAVLVI